MPPVQDGGGQSSCVGWAVGYYLKTYQESIEKGWNTSVNAYSPSWIYNHINGGVDRGSSVASAMQLLVDTGCDFKDNFPYSATNYTTQPDEASFRNAFHYKAQSWSYVPKSADDMKAWLSDGKALVISIPMYPDLDHLNASNPIYDNFSGTSRGNHAVCVVGYDDGRQAFKFINSWGTGWGLGGYGWISYAKIPSINNVYLLTDKVNLYDEDNLVGDFNHDSIADVLTANGAGWYVSWGGRTGLKRLNTSGVLINQLAVADFNGDGYSDVFHSTDGQWKVSYSGTGKWEVINTASEAVSSLGFGDFNGDKKADVFFGNGTQWKISYGGNTKWTIVNLSGYDVSNLKFGDFNNDHKSDVFVGTGTEWKASYSATSVWDILHAASPKAPNVLIGDFNNDGKADVFYPDGSKWNVSYGGTTVWSVINSYPEKLPNLKLGDFNGDGKADVFYSSKNGWKVSTNGTYLWSTL
ncbi:MAG: FG-GAP-like repeat-containing protein [Agriterribacter sp.]